MLANIDLFDADAAQVVLECAAIEVETSRSTRLDQWQHRIKTSESALFSWLRRDVQELSYVEGVPIEPQLKVEHFQASWKSVWNPCNPEPSPSLEPLLNGILLGTWTE